MDYVKGVVYAEGPGPFSWTRRHYFFGSGITPAEAGA